MGTMKAYPCHDINVRIFWHKGILTVRSKRIPKVTQCNKIHIRTLLRRDIEW